MKVLFIKFLYAIDDGSSAALYEYIKNNSEISDYKVFCRKIISHEDDLKIHAVNHWKEIETELSHTRYDIIHYFKTFNYDLFNWIVKSKKRLKLKIPIVTTITQRPSYPTMLLSPKEIRESDRIVLIDRAAYNDPLYPFLPEEKKLLNYFGRDKNNLEYTASLIKEAPRHEDTITIGRGSTLNKCPKDIIEIFDKIKYQNKKLIIAGIPDGSWLHACCAGRDDIEIIPPMKYKDWLKTCASFDIFWYYIPNISHSSIDGTLGDAMLLEKPVVYMGSEAPKERFKPDQSNGFIAENKEEMVKYIDQLCNDRRLRNKIGKYARQTTIEDFSLYSTIRKYNELYHTLLKSSKRSKIKIPISYLVHFVRYSHKAIIRSMISGTFLEKILLVNE